MFTSLVGLVLTYIIIALTLDAFYFRRFRLRRVVFHSILLFITASVMFGIVKFFNPEIGWGFVIVFILLSLIVSILLGIGNYFNVMFVQWRLKRLTEKYSKLPDGPQKQSLLKLLDKIESVDFEKVKYDVTPFLMDPKEVRFFEKAFFISLLQAP